jgi:hypothetical protein
MFHHGGEPDVNATDDVGIHDFAEDLAIGKPVFLFNGLMFRGVFGRTSEYLKLLGEVR